MLVLAHATHWGLVALQLGPVVAVAAFAARQALRARRIRRAAAATP